MPDRIDAINALIASRPVLPPLGERERLRKAHGLTQEQVSEALGVRKATLIDWEKGRTVPRPPQRDVYAHFLSELAKLYPPNLAEAPQATALPVPAVPVVPEALAGPAAAVPPTPPAPVAPAPAVNPGATTRPSSTSRRPAARKAAKEQGDNPARHIKGDGHDAVAEGE